MKNTRTKRAKFSFLLLNMQICQVLDAVVVTIA